MSSSVDTRIAVIIPAKNESAGIASTIRATSALPGVDLVIVVDDGSTDNTQGAARAAGATVVRHSVNRGKASAMETGVKVARMREDQPKNPRYLLFADADLGDSAVELLPLFEPVLSGRADCTIANFPRQAGAGGHGIVTGTARSTIEYCTGWRPRQPLSGQRFMTAAAFETATPLATGWGVEMGMTIDMLVAGLRLQEVECNVSHRVSKNNVRGYLHRGAQLRGVLGAAASRYFNAVKIPLDVRADAENNQQDFQVYSVPNLPKQPS